MKVYLFRHPDGSYRQKNGNWWEPHGKKRAKEISLKSLYHSRGSLRVSLCNFMAPAIAAFFEYPTRPEKPYREAPAEWEAYWTANRAADLRRKAASTDKLFELFEIDGYKVIEVELARP